MPRRSLEPSVRPEAIRPRATPRNFLIQPTGPGNAPTLDGGTAGQLAQALSDFNPALRRYAQVHARQQQAQNEKEFERGKREFLKSAVTFREAVKKGVIDETENPWFIRGWKEQQGRVAGQEATNRMFQEWQQWEDRNSNDPNAINEFIQQQRQKVFEDVDDPFLVDGMDAELSKGEQQLMAHHRSYTQSRIKTEARQNTQQEFLLAIDESLRAGDVDLPRLHSELNVIASRERMLAMPGSDINEMMVDAVVQKAKETGNEDLLDVLFLNRPDGTPGPGDTQYGREEIAKAQDYLLNKQIKLENHYWTQKERREEEFSEQVLSERLQSIAQNPAEPVNFDDPALQEAAKFDPNIITKLNSARESFLNATEREDPFMIAWAFEQATHPDPGERMTNADLLNLAQTGVIRDPDTVEQLARTISRARENGMLDDDLFQKFASDLRSSIRGGDFNFSPNAALDAAKAHRSFMREWFRFYEQNPNASEVEKLDFFGPLFDRLVKRYGSSNIDIGGDGEGLAERLRNLQNESEEKQ